MPNRGYQISYSPYICIVDYELLTAICTAVLCTGIADAQQYINNYDVVLQQHRSHFTVIVKFIPVWMVQ